MIFSTRKRKNADFPRNKLNEVAKWGFVRRAASPRLGHSSPDSSDARSEEPGQKALVKEVQIQSQHSGGRSRIQEVSPVGIV